MAEQVQSVLEETVPELRKMKKLGLFTSDEIKSIIKRRTDLLYKISRRKKQLKDYQKYIKYEWDILTLIQHRRISLGIPSHIPDIDYAISNRIQRYFKLITKKFRSSVETWLSFLEFCKVMKLKGCARIAVTNMLKTHTNKPKLWIRGAQLEFEMSDPGLARKTFLRGIALNPESKELYSAYFKMELDYADMVSSRNNFLEVEGSDVIVEGKIAEIAFENAAKQFPDAEFICELIHICQEFPERKELKDKMVDHLKENYGDSEAAWKTLILLHKMSKRDEAMSVEGVREEKFKLFEEAVAKVNTVGMWSHYIDELKSENIDEQVKDIQLEQIMSRAAQESCLAVEYFMTWIELAKSLKGSEEEGKILELATSRYPASYQLWMQYYQWALAFDNLAIARIIEIASKSLPENEAAEFWALGLEKCLKSKLKREKWFRLCVSTSPRIARNLKKRYLEMVFKSEGVDGARVLYKELWMNPPITAEFVTTMADFEKVNNSPIAVLRDIFNKAISLSILRHKEVGLWIQYILLESNYPGGNPLLASQLHERALRELEDPEIFNAELELARK